MSVPAAINPKLATKFLNVITGQGLVDVYFQREHQIGDRTRINACILDVYSHRDNSVSPFEHKGVYLGICEWFACDRDKDFTLAENWRWTGGGSGRLGRDLYAGHDYSIDKIIGELHHDILPCVPSAIFLREGPDLLQKILLSTMDELIAVAQSHVDWKMGEVAEAMQVVSDFKFQKKQIESSCLVN